MIARDDSPDVGSGARALSSSERGKTGSAA